MTAPHPSMQPPSYFVQHPQASGMAPQQASPAGIFPPQRGPLQFGSPHQLQLHQQAMQGGHMGIRPMGINNNNGMQQQPETSLGGSGANGKLLCVITNCKPIIWFCSYSSFFCNWQWDLEEASKMEQKDKGKTMMANEREPKKALFCLYFLGLVLFSHKDFCISFL